MGVKEKKELGQSKTSVTSVQFLRAWRLFSSVYTRSPSTLTQIADPVTRPLLTWTARGRVISIFILRENIHAPLSVGVLNTISKNNLRGIILRIRPI